MRRALLLFIILGCHQIICAQDSTKKAQNKLLNSKMASPMMLPPPPNGATIDGPINVNYGQTCNYTFSYLYPNVTWVASNGLVLNSTLSTAEVVWSGSIGVVSGEDRGFQRDYAFGGPNLAIPSYNPRIPKQTLIGTLSVYSNGTLEASIDVTITEAPLNGGNISANNQVVVEGQTPSSLTYSGASGGTGLAFDYQWQTSTDDNTWSDISGATGLTYNPGLPQSKYSYYRVKATQGSAQTYSSVATINKILTATPPPIVPVQDDNYTIDLSKTVGTTEGKLNVNSTGGSQYTIPIQVLPGTNGLQPNISLYYNSRAGTGIAAKGWNLSCLSEIKRSGKKFYFDGKSSPVTFSDSNDIFELDGQRLFVISGENGADGTIYGKESEDYSKIVSYGGAENTGPDWFQVTQKDGTIMEYGRVSNAKYAVYNATYIWLLNKVIDRNGNYCLFKYNVDPEQEAFALTEIDYTGNDATGLQPYNKILFSYSIKPHPENTLQFKDGVAVKCPYLLDTISVINGSGTVMRRYLCGYTVMHGQYYLKTVSESGSDGSIRNPLIFNYGSSAASSPVALSPMLGGLQTDGSIYSGNFHGNGIYGLISANCTMDNNGLAEYLGFSMYGTVANDPGNPQLKLDYSENLNGSNIVYDLPNGPRGRYDALTSDYDGDGKADVLFSGFSDSSGVRKLKKVQIDLTRLRANGKYGYDSIVNTNMPDIAGVGIFNYVGGTYIIPGDFDGDGYQDYILILGTNSTDRFKAFFCSPHKNIYNLEINNLGIQSNTLYMDEYYASSIAYCQVRPVDIDGDGKTELMVSDNSKTHFLKIDNLGSSTNYDLHASEIFNTTNITAELPIYTGDFNGDGMTDFLVRSTSESGNNSSAEHTGMYGLWNIFYSTGTGLNNEPFVFRNAPALKGDGFSNTNLLMVADINADGKSDVWQSLDFIDGNTGVLRSKHTVYYKIGGADVVEANNGFLSETDTTETSINSDATKEPVFGDFNGDGKTDVLTIQNSSVRFVYPAPDKECQMLAQVINGLGSKTKILYDRLNKDSVYTNSEGSKLNGFFNNFESGLYVVGKVTSSDGIGGETAMSYHYWDATRNATRGFVGFKSLGIKNEQTGMNAYTVAKFNVNYLLPTVYERFSIASAGDTIKKQVIEDTLLAITGGLVNRRFVHRLNSVISYDGITGEGSVVNNTYDNFGNIIKTVTKKGVLTGNSIGNSVETTTINTIYGIHNTTVAAFPNSITYSNIRSGAPSVSKVSTYSYDNKGNTLVVKHYSGTAKAVTTTYTYNEIGNEIKVIKASSGLNNRSLEKLYDSKGRFIIETKQSGSGIVKSAFFTFDDWGNLVSKKTSAGLTTTYQYDAFGNVKKRTLPEGYSIGFSYGWESTSGSRYSVAETRPGGGRDIKTFYDELGRPVIKQISGFNSQTLTENLQYNGKGQLIKSIVPHYSNETAVATNFTYDNVSRITKISNSKSYTSFTFSKLTGGNYKVTTTKSSGQSTSRTIDASGQLINATDNGGTLTFSYDSWGNRLKTVMGGKTLITNNYDSYGRLSSITELNSGTFNYEYDAFNQLVSQSDPLGHSYSIHFDDFGRIVSRVGPEGTTSYTYYQNASTGYNDDHVAKIIGFYGDETDLTYDALMRVKTKKKIVDGINYTTTFTTDTYGNVTKAAYPDGITVSKVYDRNGSLTATKLQDGAAGVVKNVFTATKINGEGVYTGYTLGNGKSSQITYDMTMGRPTRYYTSGIQDLNFVFDNNTGNLVSRKDAIHNLTETFTYDNLNRLTGSKVNNVQQLHIDYDNNGGVSLGNIVTKSDAGKYVYNATKINAVAYITDTGSNGSMPPPNISMNEQKIGYTPFLMTDSISEDGVVVRYKYGFGYSRVKSIKSVNGSITETRYYFSSFERQIKGSTNRYIHYLRNGKQLYAIAVKTGSTSVKVYYTYTDYLGSILAVTDSVGTIIARQNFDPWGRHRNATNWSYSNIASVPDWLYRGFTGHEELPEFGVINMNGRMYDPVQGRMLAPDKLVANVLSSQAYNRFSYALNNPLLYVDPSGFLAEQSSQEPSDYWNGGYNGGDANELPDVIVGGGSFNNTGVGYLLWDIGIGQDPSWGSAPYNSPDETMPRAGGGGGYSGSNGSSNNHGYDTEVIKVNTNDNVKGDNDIQATSNKAKIVDGLEKGIATTVDSHTTAIALTAKLTFKSKLVDTGFKDALKGLSRTGTVVGAIAGGVPSLVNIITDVHNGKSVEVSDVINVTVAAGALFVEFTGLGEAYDGTVGLITAGVGLVNDIVNFF